MPNEFLTKLKVRITGIIASLYLVVHVAYRLTGGKKRECDNTSTFKILMNLIFEFGLIVLKTLIFWLILFALFKIIVQIIY